MERPGFLRAVVGLTLFGGSYLGCVYQFEILRTLGLLGALGVVVFLLAPAVLAGLWLKKHPSRSLRSLGQALEWAFEHGALMLGVVLSVVVFWAVLLALGESSLPADRSEFVFDFALACVVFAAVVYAISGGMTAAYAKVSWVRAAAGTAAIAAVLVPVAALLLAKEPLRGFCASQPGAFVLAWTAYLALGSLVLARLFAVPDPQGAAASSARAADA